MFPLVIIPFAIPLIFVPAVVAIAFLWSCSLYIGAAVAIAGVGVVLYLGRGVPIASTTAPSTD